MYFVSKMLDILILERKTILYNIFAVQYFLTNFKMTFTIQFFTIEVWLKVWIEYIYFVSRMFRYISMEKKTYTI